MQLNPIHAWVILSISPDWMKISPFWKKNLFILKKILFILKKNLFILKNEIMCIFLNAAGDRGCDDPSTSRLTVFSAMTRYPTGSFVRWQCPPGGGSIAGAAVCRDGQWIPQPECKIFVNLCCHNWMHTSWNYSDLINRCIKPFFLFCTPSPIAHHVSKFSEFIIHILFRVQLSFVYMKSRVSRTKGQFTLCVFFTFFFVICVKRIELVLYPLYAFDATSHRCNVAIWCKRTRKHWR